VNSLSAVAATLMVMPTLPPMGPARPSSAEINQQIRRLSDGRAVWTAAALEELARLTAAWRDAVAREQLVDAA
jgi:hypothetical protein